MIGKITGIKTKKMKSNDAKIARLLALENAAEFIRSHGEEGGIEQDDYPIPIDMYLRECTHVANMLQKLADKYRNKYRIS